MLAYWGDFGVLRFAFCAGGVVRAVGVVQAVRVGGGGWPEVNGVAGGKWSDRSQVKLSNFQQRQFVSLGGWSSHSRNGISPTSISTLFL
jgi:hypothetical protein